jgi:phosphonate transport system substrate-binding protein
LAQLENGSYEFACLGALMYVRTHEHIGVVPLVQRESDLAFHSVFITGANSSIHSLDDLAGKQLAFGDINSASSHLIPYQELTLAGLNPDTDLKTRYSGSHITTAALVAGGMVDAGALDETVYNTLISTGKLNSDKVRIFYTSKPFVDYVYVARKDVPLADRQKFAKALLALKEGKDDAVLKILRAKHFVPANDGEYLGIRKIARELKIF